MKHSIIFVSVLTCSIALFSCQSVPKDIPEDLSARELVQSGQTALDNGNSKAAEAYYNALLERYGADPACYAEAKFEIAHLYVKKKNYRVAAPLLEEILRLYQNVPVGTLPPAFGRLAEVDYKKIPDKYKADL